MSNRDRNAAAKKKSTDYFEVIVYTLAAIVVGMLAAHWIGIY